MTTYTYITIETDGTDIINVELTVEMEINHVHVPTVHTSYMGKKAEQLAAWARENGRIDYEEEYSTAYIIEG